MKEFRTRALSAVIFVIIMVGGTLYSEYSYFALMLLLCALSLNEYFNIIQQWRDTGSKFISAYKVIGITAGVACFVVSSLMSKNIIGQEYLIIFPLLFFLYFIIELFARGERPFRNIGLNITGVVYIGMPMFLLNYIAFNTGSYDGLKVIGILLLIWSYDAFAYIFGRMLGKTPLMPRISPKKTVEGLLGGSIMSILVAILYSLLFEDKSNWVMIAVCVIIFGTLGDLVQSMLKRSLEIKDTGTMMPGHGGFLDRFDAFFFAIPWVAACLILFG